jgi:hypothetical protein
MTTLNALIDYCGDSSIEVILNHLDVILNDGYGYYDHVSIIFEEYGVTEQELINFEQSF